MLHLQPVFVLHSKPYRNTSLWLDLFTLKNGRVRAIARGARRLRAAGKVLLQPFVPLLLSYTGRTDLKSLRHVEALSSAYHLQGMSLFSGLYLNELLCHFLADSDSYPTLFQRYQITLAKIASCQTGMEVAPWLRMFEKVLLRELGYELCLTSDVRTQAQLYPDSYYFYDPNEGLSVVPQRVMCGHRCLDPCAFLGRHLIAIEQDYYEDVEVLQAAKRLFQTALTKRLEGKLLYSRRMLFNRS